MLKPLFTPWFKQEPFSLKLKQAQILLEIAEKKLITTDDLAAINTSKESEQFYWNYSMLKMRARVKEFWTDHSREGSTNERYVRNLIKMMPDEFLPMEMQDFD